MRNTIKLTGILAVLALTGLIFWGCEDPPSYSGPPALTGTVSISGTAQVGQVLTADTSGLGGSGIITFQWMKNGSTVIGSDSTYTVQSSDIDSVIIVTVARSDNSGSVKSAATGQVTAAPSGPVASDFDIGNLNQTVGKVTAVTITPKEGKSTGSITVYYNGSTSLPSAVGTYTITFDVAAATGWSAANGLSGGTLTISAQVNAQAPVISTQPTGGSVRFGGSHSLTVTATSSDNGTLAYQWYSNTSASNTGGTIISGATTATYNPPTGTAGTFYYFVEVKNTISNNGDGGTKTATLRSNAVTLTVNAKVIAQTPNITSQPANATVSVGATDTSLSVTANVTDGGTLTYKWYSNTSASNTGGTATGGTSKTYNPPVSTAGTYYYFVEVINTISDNGDGGTKTATVRSNAVTLTVNERINAKVPVIEKQPTGGTVIFGGSHSLTVTASAADSGTLSYQWYSNTSASNTGGTIISGATSATYNPPTSTAGTFYYFVEVKNTISNNGDGGVKTATVRSEAATLTVNYPPLTGTVSITGNIYVGQTLTANTSELGGNGNITYQWKRGEINIGTNSSTYTIQSADVNSVITVTVTRANNSGSVTSAPTQTIILPPLTGTVSITGTAHVGQTLTANTASLGGSGTITYQWKRGEIVVGTSSTYAIQTADAGSSITVTVTRSENSGSVTSAPTASIILPPLTGTVSITGTARVGQTLTANTNSLGGSGTITYQWKRGETNVGTNSNTYIIKPTDVDSTIKVTVTRSNNSDSISSASTDIIGYGFIFTLIDNNTAYAVSKGLATAAEVVIPAVYNGLPVTQITTQGFKSYSTMTSIIIPDSVTSIGNYAFEGCTGLTSITIPDSVTSIGSRAFMDCNNLTSITIPFVGTKINEIERFEFCYIFNGHYSGSTDPNIPSSLKTVIITGGNTIQSGAFSNCKNLTSIILPDSLTSIDYATFSGCTGLTSITIPDGVTSIGDYAFAYCSGLTSITISNSVTSISDTAFYFCRGLNSINVKNGNIAYKSEGNCLISIINNILILGCNTSVIPNSVTSIGNYAFSGRNGLTSITIPNSVTSIGEEAFSLCEGLKSITISNSVTSIGYSAFRGCTSLTSVTIPNSVTSIGIGAFQGCSGLTGITIPNSVTSIGASAFFRTGLTSITIPNSVKSISSNTFELCTGLTSVTIPDSVTSIGYGAFYGTGLTSITIPNSVTSIGDSAFEYCASLISVTLGANVNTFNSSFPGNLSTVYSASGIAGTYTRVVGSSSWVKK